MSGGELFGIGGQLSIFDGKLKVGGKIKKRNEIERAFLSY